MKAAHLNLIELTQRQPDVCKVFAFYKAAEKKIFLWNRDLSGKTTIISPLFRSKEITQIMYSIILILASKKIV
jgi:hypothetical protein